MKKQILLILCIAMLNKVYSQKPLVRLDKDKLTYSTQIEKQEFEKIANGNDVQILDLALCIDTNLTIQKKEKYSKAINEIISRLEARKIINKPYEKRIKEIHEDLHKNVFKKYELISDLPLTLDQGIYNCVSGTILYTILLQHFNIPYDIREQTGHVYLIADPEDKKIRVESTDPVKGYYMYDATAINKTVKSLITNKIISSDEATFTNNSELLEKYVLDERSINVKKLISFQYSNRAIQFSDAEDPNNALTNTEKAYFLNASIYSNNLLLLRYLDALDTYENDDKKISQILYIKSLYPSLSNESIMVDYRNYVNKKAITKGDYNGYVKTFVSIIETITDSLLKAEMYSVHYQVSGYYYGYKGDYFTSMYYYNNALKYNSDDIEVKQELQNAFAKLMYDIVEADELPAGMDEDSFAIALLTYIDSIPSLKESKVIARFYNEVNEYYSYRKYYVNINKYSNEAFDAHLTKSIAALKNNESNTIEANEKIAELCHHYSIDFFKLGNYDKSRELLALAIKYDPNNTMYKTRYNDMKGYTKSPNSKLPNPPLYKMPNK